MNGRLQGKVALVTGAASGIGEARFINATDILIDGGRSQLYHE